jgi:hypothetical protein
MRRWRSGGADALVLTQGRPDPGQNRDFGLDPRRMLSINVMLNTTDQTDFIKLSRSGLEVPSRASAGPCGDGPLMGSVRGRGAGTQRLGHV